MDLPLLYGTIWRSLNISLSNSPVFIGGDFVRVEPLEVMCLCGFRCYPRVICRTLAVLFLSLSRLWAHFCIARYVLSFLTVSSGGTKFEIIFRVCCLLLAY